MIKVTGADGIKYIIDGERYWPEEALKEALGCKDDDIFGEIKKLKQERDELKEKCDKLKARANAVYGSSCGYSGNKAPAFRCDVISYSWELGSIHDTDSIRVELDLTPNANYKGAFDMEDLRRYIQEYGREKKLGILESIDYQNAKAARAELAFLYKTVLGKDRLDTNLSPHEVMKAILDEYKRRKEFLRELSCSLGFGDPVVTRDNIDQKEKDILERIEGLKAGVWPCENSSTFAEYLKKEFPELCKEYNVAPLTKASVRDWINYIFENLADYRELTNINFRKAEGFRKDKQALSDSLAELRAKIREIYRSVVDDEWGESLSYASALNDINEEYKRVVHNFEERTEDWSKAQQELDRYKLAVGSLCNIPAEHREDISWIEDAFNSTKKDALKWKDDADRLARLRSNICTALCLGHESCDGNIIGRIHMLQDRHDKLCKDYTDLRQNLMKFRKNAIADLKNRGFFFRPEEDEDLPEIFAKLLKRYDWAYGEYKEQYRLRQMWHARWESENERANGVQKKLDKLRSIEAERDKYKENCKYWSDMYSSSEAACGALKGKIRELKDEKTKVISALGQDIWDDCLK